MLHVWCGSVFDTSISSELMQLRFHSSDVVRCIRQSVFVALKSDIFVWRVCTSPFHKCGRNWITGQTESIPFFRDQNAKSEAAKKSTKLIYICNTAKTNMLVQLNWILVSQLTRNVAGRDVLRDAACTVLTLKIITSPRPTSLGMAHFNSHVKSPGTSLRFFGMSHWVNRCVPGHTLKIELHGLAFESEIHVV